MAANPVLSSPGVEKPQWYQSTAKYAQPDLRIALRQIITTLIPYLLLFALMIHTVLMGYSYWITLAIAVPAAALIVRLFILFHDCTHGSFLPSPRWNRNVGCLLGLLAFTPFHDWRRSHARHHITVGDLDRRGIGDVMTLTVKEYMSAPPLKRLGYRLYRSPAIMFTLGPLYSFLVAHRWPGKGAAKWIDYYSVILTNLAILALIAAVSLAIGLKTFVMAQLPIVFIGGPLGVWLFYIQHQFEGVYWARHGEWDPWRAAIEGASYYKMPKILQWITGSIGYHHVHHVRPGIPNYHLQQCHDETPELQTVKPITLRSSLKSLRLNLWDEDRRKLVSFSSLKAASKPDPSI